MSSRRSFRRMLAVLILLGFVVVPYATSGASGGHGTTSVVNVWSEPESGYGFLDAAINSARHSIAMSMYELADSTIEDELIARANAGVDVSVILNAAYEGTEHNATTFALLHASKVHVEWAPSGQIFHAKYVVIDATSAYIGSGNLQSVYYASTRDFWVEDTHAGDVSAVLATFNADFAHAGVTHQAGGLVWSPGSTSTLVDLIGAARHSLLVENEEMDSASIESALRAAAGRGVVVKVVMTESSSWTAALESLARSGVHVRVLRSSQVYIHAKVICVDCTGTTGTVFIGSENFSTSSLAYNRELGLITTTPRALLAVESAVNGDYGIGTSVAAPVVSAPPSSGGSGQVTVTAFESAVSPGAEDSLRVHSSKPDDTCELTVTLPSGYVSESRGLGTIRANVAGNVTWTWEIGPSTNPGTAEATVTCTAGRVQRNFTIR